MSSNYKRIGDYIELVDERNTDLSIDLLLGLTVEKRFIPSVANTVGTNMKNYKIIRKNQFACSTMQVRRDKKMPVAILKDFEKAIISQAYPVFQVVDESILDPDYLMMWFSRAEFDRQATFHAVGGVRGSLEWEDFLDFELPIPSIEKQREIVNEYNTVTNRIKLNEQLNQKLEETAQALYRHWFVDFEFPNEEGKPYKSSGGEMVYNEELDKEIPVGWEVDYLNDICEVLNKKRKPISGIEREDIQGEYPYYGAMGIVDYIDKYIFEGTYVLVSEDGVYVTDKNGNPSLQYVWGKFWVNNHAHILQGNDLISTEYLMLALKNTNVSHLVTGAAQPKINLGNLSSIQLQVPNDMVLNNFNRYISKLYEVYKSGYDENKLLLELQAVLLSKMSKVKEETKKEVATCN